MNLLKIEGVNCGNFGGCKSWQPTNFAGCEISQLTKFSRLQIFVTYEFLQVANFYNLRTLLIPVPVIRFVIHLLVVLYKFSLM